MLDYDKIQEYKIILLYLQQIFFLEKMTYSLKKNLIYLLFILPNLLAAQSVNSWLTSADKSKLFQQQAPVKFSNAVSGGSAITIDTNTHYQTIDGFGFSLTEGSAEVISTLVPAKQDSLLKELFDPLNGIGISVLRISIGASDLSPYSYSYDEVPSGSNDAGMTKFSLAGPDSIYLFPMLKKILAINPNIKILATPWSAPRWMKTKFSWIGGSLDGRYYAAYTSYFVKYLDAMKALGIPIWAIAIQNEPENPKNEPSMTITAVQSINFINKNLGPGLKKAGYKTKILAFDHNCDHPDYPISVCNQSPYVDGSAFHLYIGDISILSDVHTATGKDVYFTEQYTASNSVFSVDLAWHMKNVMIGAVNNWARVSLEWNLATNENYGPHTPGGCTTCLGGITINDSTHFTRNVSYYVAAHMSKLILPGARRVGLSNKNEDLLTTACKNADGSTVLIVMNNGPSAGINVAVGEKHLQYTIPANTAASFVWK